MIHRFKKCLIIVCVCVIVCVVAARLQSAYRGERERYHISENVRQLLQSRRKLLHSFHRVLHLCSGRGSILYIRTIIVKKKCQKFITVVACML